MDTDIDDVRGALLSDRAQTLYLALPLAAMTAFLAWRLWTAVPTLLFVLYVLVFVAGLAFIPLLAMTIGPLLPGFITEGLSTLIFALTMVGTRRGELVQYATGEYDIERGDPDREPRAYWYRWAMAPLGLTFEATREAFEPTVASEDRTKEIRAMETFDDGGPGEAIAEIDMERGGPTVSWYVEAADAAEDRILVPLGQKLAELRGAGGPLIGIEAYAEALKDYGGDTSDYSNRTRLAGTFVFTVLGIGLGWIVLI